MFRVLGALPALALALVACDDPAERTMRLELEAYRRPCTGEGQWLCLQVRAPGEADPGHFYDAIEGLAPQWGHRYVVDVAVRDIPDPPEDASSVAYRLLDIVSDETVVGSTSFTFPVPAPCQGCQPFLTVTGAAGGALLDDTPFVCAEAATCTAIADAIAAGTAFTIDFRFADKGLLPLVATAVAAP